MSVVEFHNNGVIDSLTHAPAPAIFLENLKREHARFSRSTQPISVISFSLAPSSLTGDGSTDEEKLIEMARRIRREMRSDEFFTRISEYGFWAYINGSYYDAEALASRIVKKLGSKRENTWYISVSECVPGRSCDDWIKALDLLHFR